MLESFRHRGPGSIKGKRVCHSSDLHASTNERTQRGRGLSAPSLSSHGQVLAARYDDYADHEQAARMQKSEECVGHTCIRRGSMPRCCGPGRCAWISMCACARDRLGTRARQHHARTAVRSKRAQTSARSFRNFFSKSCRCTCGGGAGFGLVELHLSFLTFFQQPGSAWHATTQSRAAGQSAHRALEPCVVHVQSRERHAALSGLCPRRNTHSDAMPFLLGICFLPIDALLHYHRIPVSPGRAPRACQRTKAQRLLAQAGPEPVVPTRLLAQRPPPMHHWQPMFPPSLRAARG